MHKLTVSEEGELHIEFLLKGGEIWLPRGTWTMEIRPAERYILIELLSPRPGWAQAAQELRIYFDGSWRVQ
jgi:hypothetical protein